MNYIKYEVLVYPNGTREWRLNGKPSRENGPAIEYGDGCKAWYLNGNLHREDGPAIEHTSGYKAWYLNGEELTKAEHTERTQKVKELTIKEIEKLLGYRVKVVK